MKTHSILVFILLLFTINLFAQSSLGGCKESQPSSTSSYDDPTCQGLSMFYPTSNSYVQIPINFIFLSPPATSTETGRWDTSLVSQAYCQAILDSINYMLDNLHQPALVLPNPAPFISKTLIKFNFKSMTKLKTSGFDT